MRHDEFSGTCIGAIYKARVSTASKAQALSLCEVHTRKNPGVYVTEVSAGVVRVSSGNETVLWRLFCPGRSEANVTTTKGTQFVSVPSGCSLSGLDVTYKMLKANLQSSTNVQLVTWSSELPHPWTSRFKTLVNVTQLLHDADVWRKANELEVEFRQHVMAEAQLRGDDNDLAGFIVAICAGVLIVIIIAGQCLMWRMLKAARGKWIDEARLTSVVTSGNRDRSSSSDSDAVEEPSRQDKRRRRRRRAEKSTGSESPFKEVKSVIPALKMEK